MRCKVSLLVLGSFLVSCYGFRSTPGEIQDATLDLNEIDLEATGPIALSGEWQLYWNRFLDRESELPPTPTAMISVPSSWAGLETNRGAVLPGQGYATLVLDVQGLVEGNEYGFFVEKSDTAYRLLSDDSLLARGGWPGTNAETNTPLYRPDFSTFKADSSRYRLYWQIANYEVANGGPQQSIVFGTRAQIDHYVRRRYATDYFVAGVIAIFGVYHLILYFLRRQERAPLYFAVLCLNIVLRGILTGYHIEELFPDWNLWHVYFFLHYATQFVGMIAFVGFLHEIFFPEFSKRITLVVISLNALFLLMILVLPARWYALTLPVYHGTIAFVVVWVSFVMLRGVASRSVEHMISFTGVAILLATAVNDVLSSTYHVIHTPLLISVGQVVFIFAQAVLIARSNAANREQAEYLSHNLALEVEKQTEELKRRQEEIILELKLARMVQENLLPGRDMRVRGARVSSVYVPMADLAGDIYDIVEFEDDSLGVLVADVKGHGVPAALISMMIKISFANHAQHLKGPGATIEAMNREFCRTLMSGDYFTAAYAILNEKRNEIEVVRAGHPEPLLYSSASQDFEWLSPDGMLLGLMPEETFEIARRRVSPGDRLILYTDALLEELNAADEQYEHERLLESARRSIHLTAPDMQAALLADLRSFKEGLPIQDDVTLVIVEVTDED